MDGSSPVWEDAEPSFGHQFKEKRPVALSGAAGVLRLDSEWTQDVANQSGRSGDIIKIELKLTERQRERIVRRLVDWGYLDADDCLDEDDADYAGKLGAAIRRACRGLL